MARWWRAATASTRAPTPSARCPTRRRSWRSRRAPKRSRATTSTSRSRSTASSGWTRSSCPFPSNRRGRRQAPAVRVPDVLSRIDEGELIALTRDLVRIPSVVRPGQPGATEAGVAAHVEQWLRKERFEVEVHEVAPGRPNVFGILGERESGPTLLLEGHTDVVTEGDTALWRRPPFGGDLVDGRIYGRGSADMKSGLAAAMIAAAALKRSGVDLDGRVIVGALVDEEGDMLGVKHLCGMPL